MANRATQNNDILYGTSRNDNLVGHQGDDFFDFRSSTGFDKINGQGGSDTAIFAGRYEDYVLAIGDTGNFRTTVQGHGLEAELKHVETLVFDNATVDVSTGVVQITTVSIADAVAITEGSANPQLAFTLTRTGNLSQSLDVAYTLGGSATAAADYVVPLSNLVHFEAGSATATLSLSVINDNFFEQPESVDVHLVAGSSYNFAAGAQVDATGAILDNDPPPVTAPVLHVSNASAIEGGNLVFRVSIDAATDHNISFQAFTDTGVHLANPNATSPTNFGNATAGNQPGGDYNGFPPTTYNIPAGQTWVDVVVQTRADIVTEGPETMSLRIQNATGATITSGIGNGRGVGAIIDDPITSVSVYADPGNVTPAGFNVTPEGDDIIFHFHRDVATDDLDVFYLLTGFPSGSPTSGVDFTSDTGFNFVHFEAGQTDATVVFHTLNDNEIEQAEAFALQFDFAANGTRVTYDGLASQQAYLDAGGTNATQLNIAQIVDLV